jgi:xylulokinase
MSLLGLDLGYTGCKAMAFDLEGQVLASAYREYPMNYPQPGWVELDPEAIWEHTTSAIQEVTSSLSDPVEALSVSVMGEAFTPVDRQGRPVTPTITAFDQRGDPECDALVEQIGADRFFALSGQVAGPSYPLAKICWLRQNRPDIYRAVDKFLCYGELVLSRLGLPPTIDYSMAARTLAFDVHRLAWSEPILEAARLDPELLPSIAPAGTALGTPPPQIADELGLPRSTVVVVGGHDQPCGAVGAGVVAEGQATYALGTVHVICAVLDSFKDPLGEAGFPCYPHVVPDRFVTMGYNFTGGSLLRWFRDTFAQAEIAQARSTDQDPYDLLLADLPQTPTNLLVLPHFSGTGTPWFDSLARGTVMGLTLSTERPELVKAILEGTTYELAMNLRLLQRAGAPVRELHAIGGSAKSSVDLQIRTNIMNRPVLAMKVSEAASFGAAILAGVGAGLYDSPEVASSQLAQIQDTCYPDPDLAAQYQLCLDAYEAIHPLIREAYQRLNSTRFIQ